MEMQRKAKQKTTTHKKLGQLKKGQPSANYFSLKHTPTPQPPYQNKKKTREELE
jgi:hypothetical protein